MGTSVYLCQNIAADIDALVAYDGLLLCATNICLGHGRISKSCTNRSPCSTGNCKDLCAPGCKIIGISDAEPGVAIVAQFQ